LHAASTTYTKIQQLSSEIIKNAIRGDSGLWKSWSSPESRFDPKTRTTGLPGALASVLGGVRLRPKPVCESGSHASIYSHTITSIPA
jgi:hypothetical protein